MSQESLGLFDAPEETESSEPVAAEPAQVGPSRRQPRLRRSMRSPRAAGRLPSQAEAALQRSGDGQGSERSRSPSSLPRTGTCSGLTTHQRRS